MSPECLLGSRWKAKSTKALNTEAAMASSVTDYYPPSRKDSDSTLVDEPARLTENLKSIERSSEPENPLSPVKTETTSRPLSPHSSIQPSPSSVSSVDTQTPSVSQLEAFHATLSKQGDGFYQISSPEQLMQLLDFHYRSPSALVPAKEAFPYLHGMTHVRQKVYFHELFDTTSDMHLLQYSPDEIRELFPHDLTVETPEIPFNLMTVNSLSSEKPRLVNSVRLDDIVTQRFYSGFPCSYAPSNLVKFCDVHKLEDELNTPQELVNRNFESQTRLMAPASHFLIYNNSMNYRSNLKVAGVIDSLRSPHQNIYFVEFPVEEWCKCSPYLEVESTYTVNGASTVLDSGSYRRKLHFMEQHLLWQLNGMKEVFPKLFIGNVFNFRQMVSSKDDEQNFKLHIHCHERASLPTLDALAKIYKSLESGNGNETYYLEFPDSIAKHTSELTAEEVLSFLNVLKIIHITVLKRNEKAFVYSFDGFSSISLLVLSLSLMWTSECVEDAALNIFRKPAFKLYIYRDDFAFLKQFEQFIFWLRQDICISSNKMQLRLPMKDIVALPKHSPGPYDWFEEGKDMNFPAFIYNSLFLGSASHSSSLTVLATLGITRLISIDKLPVWFHLLECVFDHEAAPYEESKVLKPIYVFNEGQAKVYEITVPQSVRDKLKIQVESIMYIYNVRDDGKDSILSLLLDCPSSIQDKLLVHPEETSKTLLHCRVGVSRSATLAIASVMKNFELDVLESYLYVRVRRFNVVIQPNLRLFYELFVYDEVLQRKRDPNFRRKYCWWVVCEQIARLNHSYTH